MVGARRMIQNESWSKRRNGTLQDRPPIRNVSQLA